MLSRLVKGSQVVDLINKQYDEWQNGARAKGKVEDDGSDVQTKRTLVQTRRKLVSELTESRKENIDVSNRHATFLEMGYSQQSSYLK